MPRLFKIPPSRLSPEPRNLARIVLQDYLIVNLMGFYKNAGTEIKGGKKGLGNFLQGEKK